MFGDLEREFSYRRGSSTQTTIHISLSKLSMVIIRLIKNEKSQTSIFILFPPLLAIKIFFFTAASFERWSLYRSAYCSRNGTDARDDYITVGYAYNKIFYCELYIYIHFKLIVLIIVNNIYCRCCSSA